MDFEEALHDFVSYNEKLQLIPGEITGIEKEIAFDLKSSGSNLTLAWPTARRIHSLYDRKLLKEKEADYANDKINQAEEYLKVHLLVFGGRDFIFEYRKNPSADAPTLPVRLKLEKGKVVMPQ